jgi:membrane protease YdiL (CAAX protease family)
MEDIMTIIKAFIKRHPVLTYFVLTFVISWGLVLLVIGGPVGIPGTPEQTTELLPIVVLVMLVGPFVAGILLTGLVYGRAGFREFLSRLLRWRVGVRWYAVAILTTPVLATAALLALLPTSPVFIPGIVASGNKASLLLSGIVAGMSAGIFEESGWTGFAIPELRRRHGVLATGLIVGLLWGAWHYLVAFWGGGNASGEFDMPLFLAQMLFYVAALPAYRVLMVWVYDRTGSLLLAMLMHASLTGFVLFILMPMKMSGAHLLAWYLVFAAALWVVVAAVAVTNRRQLSQRT